MKIKDLKPAEYNPRKITEEKLAALKKSLAEFGDLSGIVYNRRTARLIGGHQRIKTFDLSWPITKEETQDGRGTVAHGYVETPHGRITYREVDWLEAKEKAANIAANKHGGEWDEVMLAELLGELKAGEFDPDLLGFDAAEIDKILLAASPQETKDAEPQIDKAAELNKTWQVKLGDLWQIGEHRLLCGDSTKAADVGRVMGGGKAILMVTDPPYGVDYDPDWRNRADRANGKPYGARAVGLVTNDTRVDWKEAYLLFTGDVAYVWHCGRSAKEVSQNIDDAGFDIISQCIWAKNNFAISRGDYHYKHEPCWYAVRRGKKHNWQGSRSETSLWEIDKPLKSETGHSTQKPLECMARPIRNNSAVGESVYDPFLGSGTTMVAAQNLGRKCYGIELSPGYCAVILQRMTDAFPGIEIKRISEK